MRTPFIPDPKKPIQGYFAEISKIPRDSGKEKTISDYVVAFAKARGLWFHQDPILNVIVKKPGTAGYENHPPVMLQGHMDMVCVKTPESTHDFSKDPIELLTENDRLYAKDTSLGADNGVAVAYMLALLDDTAISHPPLECVFTSQEESGTDGAKLVDTSLITARKMIGLDGAGETTSYVACFCSDLLLLEKKYTLLPITGAILSFQVSGISSRHFGGSIHPECGNAIKIVGRLLEALAQRDLPFHLTQINGGVAENYRPIQCCVEMACPENLLETIKEALENEFNALSRECDGEIHTGCLKFIYGKDEGGSHPESDQMLSDIDSKQLSHLLYLLPNNVFQWDFNKKELISINNLGKISFSDGQVAIRLSSRSKYESVAIQLKQQCRLLANTLSFHFSTSVRYRPWPYLPNSPLRALTNEVFVEVLHSPLEEATCPGGLEIAIFVDKIPGLDAVMLGPICENFHTTDEYLDLASYDRMYLVLEKILARL